MQARLPAVPAKHFAEPLQSFLGAVQVAEVMAKVAEQVREAEDEAERRSPILNALQDITSMHAECAWLASYEKDDARFKVGSQHSALPYNLLVCGHTSDSLRTFCIRAWCP